MSENQKFESVSYIQPAWKRRRFKRAKPEVIADILKLALKKKGIDKTLARYRFFQNWQEIVGLDIAKRATPEYLRGKTLVVKVSDAIWAQELSFQKEVILRRIQKFAGKDAELNDLHFIVGR